MNELKKKSYLRYVDFEDQFNKAYMIVEVWLAVPYAFECK